MAKTFECWNWGVIVDLPIIWSSALADVLDAVIFWSRHCGLGTISDQMFPSDSLLFQKTAEEDQFEDLVKHVKEGLKEQWLNLIHGNVFHAFIQIGRGIRKPRKVKKVIKISAIN